MNQNSAYTNYPDCNPVDFIQPETLARDTQLYFSQFERGQLLSAYELSILELVHETLGNDYWYFVEFPLQLLCNKSEHTYLPKELWQFWVNSRVDIAIMNASMGEHCRKACLILECQSPWHDLDGAEQRDRTKAQIISSTGIPLIYVRYADYPRVLHFWVADGSESVDYNPFTYEGKVELAAFLRKHCL